MSIADAARRAAQHARLTCLTNTIANPSLRSPTRHTLNRYARVAISDISRRSAHDELRIRTYYQRNSAEQPGSTHGDVSTAARRRLDYVSRRDNASPAQQIDSVDAFLELAARDQVTVRDAARFLWDEMSRLQRLPREDARQQAASFGAGRMLQWLLHIRSEIGMHDNRRELSIPLGWFLLAEGLDEFVWDWIEWESANLKSQHPSSYAWHVFGPNDPGTWPGSLAGGIIEAHLSWAEHGSVDTAIRALRSAYERFRAKDLHGFVNWVVAGQALARGVASDSCLPCNPELFDWFLNTNLANNPRGPHVERSRNMTVRILWHPATPDPRPFSDRVFAYQENPEDHHWSTIQRSLLMHYFGRQSLRSAYIFRMYGEMEKAKRLEDFVAADQRLSSALKRSPTQYFDADPKLQVLRERIIAAGGPRPGLLDEMLIDVPWYPPRLDLSKEVWDKKSKRYVTMREVHRQASLG